MTVTLEVAGDVAPVVMIVRVEVAAAAPGVTTGGTKSQLVPGGRPDEQVNNRTTEAIDCAH